VSAIESPLLDFPIKQAKGIVFNICGGPDLTLTEVRDRRRRNGRKRTRLGRTLTIFLSPSTD